MLYDFKKRYSGYQFYASNGQNATTSSDRNGEQTKEEERDIVNFLISLSDKQIKRRYNANSSLTVFTRINLFKLAIKSISESTLTYF